MQTQPAIHLQDRNAIAEMRARDFQADALPYEIVKVVEVYDGPRRPHRQIFFHVMRGGQLLKSFKLLAMAEKFVARAEAVR